MISMSDLVLDPPTSPAPTSPAPQRPSGLRLVSSTGTVDRTDRYRATAPLSGSARRLYCDVLAHSLHNGRRLDANALRVVISVKQSRIVGPVNRITTHDVWQLLFIDVVAWCRARRLALPHGCAVALEAIVEYLDHADDLDPASDPIHALLGAIDECTGGWGDQPPQPPEPQRSVRSLRGTRQR